MKRSKIYIVLVFAIIALLVPQRTSALSFALDSIAEWGKFPRFVVNTYRWGDKFFNGYDTTYVQSSGYKFNAKVTADSWLDGYHFRLPNNNQIYMRSNPSTSAGLHLTYLAVTAGYDVNFGKLFGGEDVARKRFRFGFNCMLFAAELYFMSNDAGTTIKRFGNFKNLNIAFSGLNNKTWGIDAYYFFNHKRYSEAASFNYSRIQKRSQGSFYTGFSFYAQDLDFNFRGLDNLLKSQLPDSWPNYRYMVNTKNYAVRIGYGYNWVFAPKWVLGVSESPVIGIRKGRVVTQEDKTSFSLYNRLKVSAVWNDGRLFFGVCTKMDLAIVNEQRTTYSGAVISAEAVFGIRFNIW